MMERSKHWTLSDWKRECLRLDVEVERLKVAAEAAATMTTTNAGAEVETLRKRVAQLERAVTAAYAGGSQDGYAACEADVFHFFGKRTDDVSADALIALERGKHRGAAARKDGG